MARPAQAFAWWSADQGALPDALGWTATGTGTPTLRDDGVRITVASHAYLYARALLDTDRAPRPGDDLVLQAAIQGTNQAPGWGTGSPIVGLILSDGARQIGALISADMLAFVNPVTGALLAQAEDGYPWTTRTVLRLEKTGSESWSAWSEGRKLLEVPYLVGPALSTTGVATGSFGFVDSAGTGTALFDQVELGLNVAAPEPFLVFQLMQSLPVRLLQVWNERHRGLLRGIIGAAADVWRVPLHQQRGRSAADLPIEVFVADGYQDPATVKPAWTVTDPGKLSLVRRRLHVEDDAGSFRLTAELSTTPLAPTDAHWQIRVQGLHVQEGYTPDGDGALGPVLRIANQDGDVYAVLGEVEGGVGWYLTTLPAGTPAPIGQAGWLVDYRQPHDVELHVLGHEVVLLLVNGRVVDRVPYSAIGSTGDIVIELLVATSTDVVFEVERIDARVSCADTRARPSFVRRLVERLIPVGGCERNDELQVWKDHRPEMLAMRGTELGILFELRRLCCSEDCYVLATSTPAAWVLGVSWPDIGPVILDADGTLLKTIVEFSWGPPGLSLDETVAWITGHLLPLSTPASTFTLALITQITGSPATPSPGVKRFPVVTTRHFDIGDIVTLRDGTDPTITEDAVILALSADTIDVATPTLIFGDGDFVRKVLATT